MFALALPVVATSVLDRLVGLVDVFLVGGLGAPAIAAVGASQLLIFCLSSLVAALPVGVLVVTAQLWGAGRHADAAKGALRALTVAAIVGCIAGAIGAAFGDRAVGLLGAAPDVVALSGPYLRVVFLAFPLTLLVMMFSSMLQGTGDTKTPLYVTILMNVVHIAIAYPAIYGVWGLPQWGVEGAAFAVAGSQAVGAALLGWLAYRRGIVQAGGGRAFVGAVLRVGLPVSVDRTLQQAAQLVFAAVVISYGTTAYAAHQVGLAIEALSFLPGVGFALAAATAVGQSLGANNIHQARRQNLEASRLAIMVMAAMGLVFFFFPYALLRLLTSDAAVIELGTLFLQIVAILQVPLAVTMVVSGSLKGAGDTRFLLMVTMAGAWGVRVPLAVLFAYGLHLSLGAVWTLMIADWVVRMVLVLGRYRSERWRDRDVLWQAGAD